MRSTALFLLLAACTSSEGPRSELPAIKNRPSKAASSEVSPRASTTGGALPGGAAGLRASPVFEGATSPPSAPVSFRSVKDAPDARAKFLTAQAQWRSANEKEAIPGLEAYLATDSNGEFADEARYLLGKRALNEKDAEVAKEHFVRILTFQPPSRRRGQALVGLAQSEEELGHRKEALSTLARLDLREVPVSEHYSLFSFWAETALVDGRGLESALANIKAWRMAPTSAAKKDRESRIVDQIESRLNESELQFVLKEYPSQFPSAPVQLRLAAMKIAAGQEEEARRLLANVMTLAPQDSREHAKAKELLALGATQNLGVTNKIGVLLPLSGKQESLGRSVLEGLKLALGKKQSGQPVQIELVTADVGPDPLTALEAFRRLVLEDKVMAVVGPLQGSQAEGVAKKAVEMGVVNITLSPRAGLTELGEAIFRVALTPEKQVRAIVNDARERLRAERFAIVFPQDNFGREFAGAYFKVVEELGGEVTAAESYDPDQSDFRILIQNMIGTGFESFRKSESEDFLKAEKDRVGRDLTRKELRSHELRPIVDFDVLFVPDTFRAVGQIVPALLYADVTKPKMVGPSTWNNSSLLNRAGQYLEGALFVDLFAPQRQSGVTQKFVNEYELTQGTLPSALAALGFDVGLALRKAYSGSSGFNSRSEFQNRLQSLGSIDGACGSYDWSGSREPLAEVQLYQVHRAAFHHLGGVGARSPRTIVELRPSEN